jgi:uncharacterized membrane protein YdbT with pleckstrin-like domain
MADRVIRPSMKQIKAGYALAVLLIVAAIVVHARYLAEQEQVPGLQHPWLPAASVLILLWPMRRHLARQATKVTITGDKLRYELGLLSKTTRNIQLSKVQDVRVDQSLGQRVLSVGDIAIETSGEASRLTLRNIDNPQTIADEIIAASQEHGSAQQSGGRP